MFKFNVIYSNGERKTFKANDFITAFRQQGEWVKKARKNNSIVEVSGVTND